MDDTVNVSIRLPNDEFVELTVAPDVPVKELQASLATHNLGLKGNKFRLMFRKQEMDPERSLDFFNVEAKKSVTLEAIVNCIDDLDLRFDDFLDEVKLSTVSQSMKNVPVDVYFTLRFKVNENGLALYLPALEDSECIHCIINDAEANRMVTVLGEKEAAVRGFCQWTSEKDMILKRRIHLIEVTDPRLEYDPSNCLYDALSPLNGDYNMGDGASWQRYTTSPPRACLLHVDPIEMFLRIIPEDPLEHDCSYAILLQNGVPCPPDFELDGPLLGFSNSAGVRHDKLIFFNTEKGAAGYNLY